MKESRDCAELQKVLVELIEDESDDDNYDKPKIIKDFYEDKDSDAVTYYTNIAAWSNEKMFFLGASLTLISSSDNADST